MKKNNKKSGGFNAAFWTLGISLGLLFGMMLGSTGIGLCFGSGLGLLLGALTGNSGKKEEKDCNDNENKNCE